MSIGRRAGTAWVAICLTLVGCGGVPKSPRVEALDEATFACAVAAPRDGRAPCQRRAIEQLREARWGDAPYRSEVSAGDLGERFELRPAWRDLSASERVAPRQGLPVVLRSASAAGGSERVHRSAVVLGDVTEGRMHFVLRDRCPTATPNCALFPMAGFRAWDRSDRPFLRGVLSALRPVKGFEAAYVHLLLPSDAEEAIDVVFIHGLASNPNTWAPLLEALTAPDRPSKALRIWLVTYPSAAPVLVNRLRIARALEAARKREGLAGRWRGVFVGHSMGGVIARLLAVDANGALLHTAFDRPWSELAASDRDRRAVEDLLDFHPVLASGTVITLAAPFRGAPGARRWPGRWLASWQPTVVPELRPLSRIARRNESAVRPELRNSYLQGVLTSLTTLQPGQPVLARSAELPVPAGIRHVAIAGTGRDTDEGDGDGIVPTASALLPSATERVAYPSRHDVHRIPTAIAKVLGEIDAMAEGWTL